MPEEAYDQLDAEEKVALKVAILYPHRHLKEVLPELFESEYKYSFSLPTYYKRYHEGLRKLQSKGILDDEGYPTDKAFDLIPASMLPEMVRKLSEELLELNEKRLKELEEKDKIESELRMRLQDLDFTNYHDIGRLPGPIKEDIDKAIDQFMKEEYDMSIVKVYKVSEELVKNLFERLYGDEELEKVRKHEDRLKKMWNDEETEKKKYPGVRLITSLFAVILWYRNKMGAHCELKPTKEASRICLESLLEAIRQLKRMEMEDVIEV
ncbi:MAG: hypothetical protein ACP5KW_12235 [Thermoproteota archaeon]